MKIPLDKILHFIAGLVIAGGVTYYSEILYGLLAGVCSALLKELYDEVIKKTEADFFDGFATAIGTAIGAVLVDIIL